MPSRDFETMFPEIGKDDLVVSQSTINQLDLSPCRWLYKPPNHQPSEPMFFGTVVHGMLEKFVLEEINVWELISPQTAEKVAFELAADDDLDLLAVMPDEERRARFMLEISEACRAWHLDWWTPIGQNLNVESIEKPYAMKMRPLVEDSAWFVTGGIDMVTRNEQGNVVLYDWKTAGRGWSNGQGTGASQKEAYAMLYAYNHERELPVAMVFVVYNRSKGTWQEHPAKITQRSVDAYNVRVDGWVEFMQNPFHLCTPSDGKKRGWWSKPAYNDVWDRCPSCRHLGDEFDDQERTVQAW